MKKINFKKLFSVKNAIFALLIFGAIFLSGHFALAVSIGEALGNVVGGIIALFIRAISSILILLVSVLMNVMAYSDFINAPAVSKGWVVVRDLCNMFFVIVLLVIAFATILGQEEYGAKKFLPKLIMAAVLINFSKLICGLMIDVSSVVMLTFVNAFAAIGAGNILDILGISEITQIAVGESSKVVTFSMIVSSYIFGLIYVVIATVVVAAMLGMLVVRLVMIWILVVMSPFAFFLQAVPGGGKYSSMWWTKWTSNLLVGPIIAFFLWLSFASLQGGATTLTTTDSDDLATNNSDMDTVSGVGSKAGTTSSMAKFVIAIGMLLGGMQVAQSVGGEAGGAMGKVFNKGKGLATAAGIGALAFTGKSAAKGVLLGAGKASNFGSNLKNSEIDPTTGKRKLGTKGNAFGNFALGWQEDLAKSDKKKRKETAGKYLKKLGIGEKGSEAGQTLIDTKGFQYTSNIVKGAALGAFTGGFGPAASLLAAGIGAAGGAGIGAKATESRLKTKQKVKDYEGAGANVTNAQGDLKTAKKKRDDLVISRDNVKTVEEFDDNKKRFEELETKGAGLAGFANTTTTAERQEYARLKNLTKDKDVISKYNKSKKYLTDNNVTDSFSEIDQKVKDAESDITVKEAAVTTEEAKFNALDSKEYAKNKKRLKNTEYIDAFRNTKAAMKDNTKKKQAAQEWVKIASNDKDLLKNINKPSEIYSSAGLSENWKARFDELNAGGGDANTAIDNMVNEVKGGDVHDKKLEAMAKAFAAYTKDGDKTINSGTLGKLRDAVSDKGYSPDSYVGKVSTQYKKLGSSVEEVKDGSGALQYETFAKNSAKAPADRKAEKDIMGVSFAKLNEKADVMGVDYKLDPAAGVNQQVGGEQLSKLSTVMARIIEDEIAALEKAGAGINSQEISQLNTAKARLTSGDVSGLSLKNSDVIYKGETDSEKRRNEYNTTQHENMHQYGASDETVVDNAAGALQEAKLVGRIPQSDVESGGKSYVEVLGSMIAKMEQSGATQEAMNQAVLSKIEKWSPSNAQRVIETENGARDSVKDVVSSATEDDSDYVKATEAINKLTESLEKPMKLSGEKGATSEINLSIATTNFLRRMFEGVKTTIKKGSVISKRFKPLTAMAVNEEQKSNNIKDVL